MRSFGFGPYSRAFAVMAVLAGCGGAQSLIGAPATMAQSPTSAIATHARRGQSWMQAESKGADLLFVSTDAHDVYIYKLPSLKLTGTLTGPNDPNGEGSDRADNVWVTSTLGLAIQQYSHGGTLLKTLSDPTGYPVGCPVDPTTGNLAVANLKGLDLNHGHVLIYQNGSGSPTTYTDPALDVYYFRGYDDMGDLYVDGMNYRANFAFAELPRAAATSRISR